jgi:DNA-binding GntR family transcriptional regulator
LNANRTVKKLRRSNLSEDAYATVKNLLLEGKRYPHGGKISVEELSRELGVSRTPIWGAINRLEAEGVVEIVPRRGVYLLSFDPERAVEIYLAREALEGIAARLAATQGKSRNLDLVEAALKKQESSLAMSDVDSYLAAALTFHQHIVQASGNKTLERLLGLVYTQIQAMRIRMKYVPTKLPHSFDDHGKILQALKMRDPELAEREARAHIRTLTAEIVRESGEGQSSKATVSARSNPSDDLRRKGSP